VLTLLYHNVLRSPARGLPVAGHQVTREIFREHVRFFHKRLIHPLHVQDELRRGKTPRGVLFTFDDGATGLIEAGSILAEFKAVGVAFICPGAVKDGLWFYRLADAIVRASAPQLRWRSLDLTLLQPQDKIKAYQILSQKLFDLPLAERDNCLAEILELVHLRDNEPDPALRTLDQKGLDRAAGTGGFIFANHSWSHPNLVKLTQTELTHEIESAHRWLESSNLPTLPWFSFPRGSYDRCVKQNAAQFCPILFGARAFEPEPNIVPRVFIQQADKNRFRLLAKTLGDGQARRLFFCT
jgi:peptidoglycan/xylan/chitin deacetylase (PgdA/CDA1 family)